MTFGLVAHRRHPTTGPRKTDSSPVRMVVDEVDIDGSRWRYAVSDNESATAWALNLHGFFAGGRMYWRESARLAEQLGWRVVVPNLPGFGGTDPPSSGKLTLGSVAHGLHVLLDGLGAGPVVVLGHSMGGAVGVQFATDHPDRTLGVVYRDGAATPSWRDRRGPVARVVSPVAPSAAVLVDLVSAAVLDLPDLAFGRVASSVRSVLPDVRRNVIRLGEVLPAAEMLFGCDLRAEVEALGAAGEIPLLGVWGRFDGLAPRWTASEFEEVSARSVVWVNGGHSWMLARPRTQAQLLRHHPRGRQFLAYVAARWRP